MPGGWSAQPIPRGGWAQVWEATGGEQPELQFTHEQPVVHHQPGQPRRTGIGQLTASDRLEADRIKLRHLAELGNPDPNATTWPR